MSMPARSGRSQLVATGRLYGSIDLRYGIVTAYHESAAFCSLSSSQKSTYAPHRSTEYLIMALTLAMASSSSPWSLKTLAKPKIP
ncbi:MAG: hypothetical protein BWX88_05324 [Planctomycetes bacterium ADurb.Bin126]|nr:MAG: hypothetical protein BWX88_05324 [Planctomycetes bacterium ADurb.Bin126]